jgi:hypothetical protein
MYTVVAVPLQFDQQIHVRVKREGFKVIVGWMASSGWWNSFFLFQMGFSA